MYDILGIEIERIDPEIISKFRELALHKRFYSEKELAILSDEEVVYRFKQKYLIYPLTVKANGYWTFTLIDQEAHRELYSAGKIIEIL